MPILSTSILFLPYQIFCFNYFVSTGSCERELGPEPGAAAEPRPARLGPEPRPARLGPEPESGGLGSEPRPARLGSEPRPAGLGPEPAAAGLGPEPAAARLGPELSAECRPSWQPGLDKNAQFQKATIQI